MSDSGITGAERLKLDMAEYHALVEERRFVMKSYMNAIIIYLALMGYTLKELLELNLKSAFLFHFLSAILFFLNLCGFYPANNFKTMATHAMSRECQLASKLGLQPPHSLLWGYHLGCLLLVLISITILGIVGNAHFVELCKWLNVSAVGN